MSKLYIIYAGSLSAAVAVRAEYFETEDEANEAAWHEAADDFDQYAGLHGTRSADDFMDGECDTCPEDIDEYEPSNDECSSCDVSPMDDSTADECYNQERENWLDYSVEECPKDCGECPINDDGLSCPENKLA